MLFSLPLANSFGGTGGGEGDVTVWAGTGGLFLGVGLGFHGTAYTGDFSVQDGTGVPGRSETTVPALLKQMEICQFSSLAPVTLHCNECSGVWYKSCTNCSQRSNKIVRHN